MIYKKIQKIFARGIDYCWAKRFLLKNKAGYDAGRTALPPCRQHPVESFENNYVKKFGEYTRDTLSLCPNEEVIK